MRCKICGSEKCVVDYKGKIRTGSSKEEHTNEDVEIWKCAECGVRFHDYQLPDEYYKNDDYWTDIIGGVQNCGEEYVQKAYRRWGDRALECIGYVGTERVFNKRVVDFGCSEGTLLDFIRGGAAETIGIELNRQMLDRIRNRGHIGYPSIEECLASERNRVDVVLSFDVIEHVDNPEQIINQLHEMLSSKGEIVMGTPTDCPVLRELMGKEFEEFLFHVGHPWIFSEKSIRILFERAGFKNIEIENVYKYSLGNVLGWLQKREPVGNLKYDFISDTLNCVWKKEMQREGKGEYLIIYASK